MARTLSVPQRGSIAAVGGLGTQQNSALFEAFVGRSFGNRGFFLLLAAVLTAAGAVIPHLDSDLLATVFFVAGAGLAMLIVVLPWQPMTDDESSPAPKRRGADAPSPFDPDGKHQVRFPELLATVPTQPSIDRAAWAKLTAHMSHELRTPLNAVLGFSELMTNEVFGPLGSGYSGYARDIHASGRILLKSAEDALAITALLTAPERKRARETSRIRAVIDDACAFTAPDLAAQSIAVAIDISGDAEIVGDHQATRQMMINLITEANRYASGGGVLRIETKTTAETVSVLMSLVSDGNDVEATGEGFGLILARTFCELSGAELTSGTSARGEWTSTVRLLRAAQADLFAAA